MPLVGDTVVVSVVAVADDVSDGLNVVVRVVAVAVAGSAWTSGWPCLPTCVPTCSQNSTLAGTVLVSAAVWAEVAVNDADASTVLAVVLNSFYLADAAPMRVTAEAEVGGSGGRALQLCLQNSKLDTLSVLVLALARARVLVLGGGRDAGRRQASSGRALAGCRTV